MRCRFLIICLILALMLCACTPQGTNDPTEPTTTQPTTEGTTAPTEETAASTEETVAPTEPTEESVTIEEAAVVQLVYEYLKNRQEYLASSGKTALTTGSDTIRQDELAHLSALQEKGITFVSSQIARLAYEYVAAAKCVEVTMTETVTYEVDGESHTESVEHLVAISVNDGVLDSVDSDVYAEAYSGFASSGYVKPAE